MTELVAIALVVAAMNGEGARLRAHFALVDRELRARDVSHLTVAQRHARATHIDRLREYAAAGVFPKNTHHPGAFVPYFVDDFGTRCAMAYLIEQSGGGEFVRRVARRSNYAYIAEIARDPELSRPLAAWLEANGLSVDEAARIQPAYECEFGCPIDPPVVAPTVPSGYATASIAAIVGGLSAVAINAGRGSGRVAGWFGAATGAVALGLSLGSLDQGREYATLRVVNGGVGLVSLLLGLYTLDQGASAEPTRVAVAPVVGPGGGSGVMLNIKF